MSKIDIFYGHHILNPIPNLKLTTIRNKFWIAYTIRDWLIYGLFACLGLSSAVFVSLFMLSVIKLAFK